MDDNKTITLKGLPMYLVAFFEYMTSLLPSLILWLTFVYGILQLVLITRQLCMTKKDDKTPD